MVIRWGQSTNLEVKKVIKNLKAKISTDPTLSDDPVEEWRGRWSRCEMVES